MTPGLTGTITLLPGEDPDDFEQLVSSLRSRFASSDKDRGNADHESGKSHVASSACRLSGLIAWAERSDLRRDELAPRMG